MFYKWKGSIGSNSNWKAITFIQENAFKIAVSKMATTFHEKSCVVSAGV